MHRKPWSRSAGFNGRDHPERAVIVTLDKESISAHPSLDVAHLALHRDAGLLSLADRSKTVIRAARPGEQLYVLHHAKGDVLKVMRAFCRAAALQPDPVKVLYHTCATHPGSSGALIFAERDGAIVGLHYASIAKTDGRWGAGAFLTSLPVAA